MPEVLTENTADKTERNKMGYEPVGRLTLKMGLPLVISMIVQALYNIVDSIFVSRMPGGGDVAMNALTLAFPVQMLMIAVGVGTGVGVNSVLSRSLGEGDGVKAGKIAGNALLLGLLSYFVFLAVISAATEYLKICCVCSFGAIFYMIYEKLLQGTGRTVPATISMMTGAAANIILDPIMIYGLCGLPAMGVAGAAYATVTGQFISMTMDALFHYLKNKEIPSAIKYLKPQKKIIGEIYAVGVPAIVMQALMSFMTYGVNVILIRVSEEAVTAYGVYYKLQQFALFAAFGLNNAQIPIVAYNYGMGDKKRINDGIKYGYIYTVAIMAICTVIFECFADVIVNIFSLADETRKLCVTATRFIATGFPFIGANVSYQGIFQALGKGVASLILSALRLIVIALPLAFLFTLADDAATLVWAAFPIAEAAAFVYGFIEMRFLRRKLDIEFNSDCNLSS
ncbi:MAG: MATE family efflux transporter [Firmicutes bacterium]|nr:MATE family efflux transporter [Bacillota bacterium]